MKSYNNAYNQNIYILKPDYVILLTVWWSNIFLKEYPKLLIDYFLNKNIKTVENYLRLVEKKAKPWDIQLIGNYQLLFSQFKLSEQIIIADGKMIKYIKKIVVAFSGCLLPEDSIFMTVVI